MCFSDFKTVHIVPLLRFFCIAHSSNLRISCCIYFSVLWAISLAISLNYQIQLKLAHESKMIVFVTEGE